MTGGRRIFLDALVTVAGAHGYSQDVLLADFLRRIASAPGSEAVVEKAKRLFENAGVEKRHLELAIDELEARREEIGWRQAVEQASYSLSRRAIQAALAVAREPWDALILVTSHVDGFPSMSRRLVEESGFASGSLFYDLTGLGCGGANHGIHLGHMLVESGRCKRVGVVCTDVLGSFVQTRRHTKAPSVSEIVGHVLPSDGAAALVLASEPGPAPLLSYRTCTFDVSSWAGSADYAFQRTGADGEPLGRVGKDIRSRITEEAKAMLNPDAVKEPVFLHAGALALVRGLATAYPQLARTAEVSARVFEAHGNLSSPTVLFALRRGFDEGLPVTPSVRLFTFGPGFYSSLLRFGETATATS